MARHASRREIGARIREARERLGWSGRTLAEKIGSDKGTVSRIENGQAGISVERLQEIAGQLGVDPSDLLRRSRSAVAA